MSAIRRPVFRSYQVWLSDSVATPSWTTRLPDRSSGSASPRFSLRDWLERDVIAEAFDAALQVGDGAGLLDLIEIGFSEFMIGDALGEHVIGGNQDFVSDGEGRAHGAAAGPEAVEFVFEVAALGPRGGDGGPDQDRAEVDVAFAGAAAPLPAGALMVAGADAGPGAQVIDAQEHAHVDADLGEEHRGDEPVDARDLHQERVRRPIGFEPLGDAQVERCYVLLDRFEPAQLGGQEEPMMLLQIRGTVRNLVCGAGLAITL